MSTGSSRVSRHRMCRLVSGMSLEPFEFRRCRLVSPGVRGVTRCLLVSELSPGVAWCRLVSPCVTWCHLVSTGVRGVARCHLVRGVAPRRSAVAVGFTAPYGRGWGHCCGSAIRPRPSRGAGRACWRRLWSLSGRRWTTRDRVLTAAGGYCPL